MKCMNSKIGKYLLPQMKSEYKREIRDVLVTHREVEAKKMDNRMDHIDLQAYGVGIQIQDFDFSKFECQINESNIMQSCSKFGFLNEKLIKIDNKLQNLIYKICSMAFRYDNRID